MESLEAGANENIMEPIAIATGLHRESIRAELEALDFFQSIIR